MGGERLNPLMTGVDPYTAAAYLAAPIRIEPATGTATGHIELSDRSRRGPERRELAAHLASFYQVHVERVTRFRQVTIDGPMELDHRGRLRPTSSTRERIEHRTGHGRTDLTVTGALADVARFAAVLPVALAAIDKLSAHWARPYRQWLTGPGEWLMCPSEHATAVRRWRRQFAEAFAYALGTGRVASNRDYDPADPHRHAEAAAQAALRELGWLWLEELEGPDQRRTAAIYTGCAQLDQDTPALVSVTDEPVTETLATNQDDTETLATNQDDSDGCDHTTLTPAATETVTEQPVTKTAAAVDPEAERAAQWAATSGALPMDGPGIIGPGTHVTYREGRGPGMRSKHGTHGMVVSIGRKAVAWRPYGSTRTLRTPLDDMRVYLPPTSTTPPATGRAAYWRTWSLADHLAYAHRPTAPTAAQEPVQALAGPLQLSLWPAEVAPHAERRPTVRPVTVTAEPVTQTPGDLAQVVPLRQPAAGPVVVIPCSAGKLDRPAPAGELYTGSLHTMCRKAADALTATGGTTLVLSARYGLVTFNQVIAPYELRIGEPGSVTVAELHEQAARLHLADATDVTVLAGAAYAAAVRAVWPTVALPLAGSRGIGEMRHRLATLARTTQAPAA
ncbi:MAG: hypothetical protein JO362_22130 [Streptomycetaceae bacterium]|nr:hypothetical protein [Streptomycetaceae bacterium]